MRMQPVVPLILCLVFGPSINAAAENDVPKPPKGVIATKVLYSAPLRGGGSDFAFFRASVVNLDSTPATVTVSFCDMNGHCDSGAEGFECDQVTLLPQHGCVAEVTVSDGQDLTATRYARIEVTSPAKQIIVSGLLSTTGTNLGLGNVNQATVPAH
jgi:hypothetical protein